MKDQVKIYKIKVPDNEFFQFWEDEGKVWHVKDPNRTHPNHNTRSISYYETRQKWESKDGFVKMKKWSPTTLLAPSQVIDNIPEEIDAYVDFMAGCLSDPKLYAGFSVFFAYRPIGNGDMLEVAMFGRPDGSVTDKHFLWPRTVADE